ncbi:heme acquisition protein HasA [Bordetella petrii]|uniref:heme acquisition protein HasA n=1 Tax=Bordetella petrii TaxID=94624 RepID=UPI001A97AE92|nr:heme acquisition protein HasA [Bordetella petrii]MBO1112228.1 heme acquisition protein HasAp [Bordetella petrii]
MSATISAYDEDNFPFGYSADDSVRDVLLEFQNSGVAGEHTGGPNEGGFFGGNAFNGTSYGFTSTTVDGYAFLATGDLHYYFPPFNGSVGDGPTAHTLWGTLESITLGSGITSSGAVVDPFVTFTFDDPLYGDIADGRTNVVHDIIWGLMNGSVTGASDSAGTISQGGLIAALEDNGLDVDQAFADLVGSSAATETELALAA